MRALLVLVLLPVAAAFDGRDAAVSYLAAAQGVDGGWGNRATTDWAMIGLAAAGEDVPAWGVDPHLLLNPPEATSLLAWSRATLALACAGYDARAFHGVDHARMVELGYAGGQFGSPAWLHDDAWAILSLRAAGVPADDPRLRSSATFLLAGQHPTGGWGWAVGGLPDVDDTGAALMALAAARPQGAEVAEARAVAYLAAARNADGGFGMTPGSASNLPSSAWGAMGLLAWGEDASAPIAYVASLQQPDGSFEYAAGARTANRAQLTGTALVPLMGETYACAS